jgi:hypothetical protein
LTRDPMHRLGVNGAEEIKRHPFFHKHIDFRMLSQKKIQPPFKPSVASPVVRRLFLSDDDVDKPLHPLSNGYLYRRMYLTLTRSLLRKHPLIVMSRIPSCLRPFKLNFQVLTYIYPYQ